MWVILQRVSQEGTFHLFPSHLYPSHLCLLHGHGVFLTSANLGLFGLFKVSQEMTLYLFYSWD